MIFFRFPQCPFLNGADCKGTNFFVSRKFFSSFLRTFFHRGGALNSPFPKRVAKVRFFPLPPNLFQEIFDFFLKRQYKSLAEMPLELQLNRREMTQRQKSGGRKGAGEKLRQKSYGRKEVTKDWNRTQKWRKPRKSRLVPDHSMWPGSAPEKHLPII